MAVDSLLAAALIDGAGPVYAPKRIFGVRVRKFCLWHKLILLSINSPFFSGGMVTLEDIRTAVGVCRLRFEDTRIRKPCLVPVLIYSWAIIKSLIRRKKTAPIKALTERINQEFMDYAGDYIQEAPYNIVPPEKRDGQPSVSRGQAPDVLTHAAELIQWGLPERRAWEMRHGLASWYRPFAQRAIGYDIDFTDENERAFQATLPEEYRRKNNTSGVFPAESAAGSAATN